MPVYQCPGCGRAISVSIAPGGNPVALADPERWARSWRGCPSCLALYCDRCAPESRPGCPRCEAPLAVPDREGFVRLYFGGPRAWFGGFPPAAGGSA